MDLLSSKTIIGVLGAGTMGSGIAQVAASAGHKTILFDSNDSILQKAFGDIKKDGFMSGRGSHLGDPAAHCSGAEDSDDGVRRE